MRSDSHLGAVGVSPGGERLYELLLDRPGLTEIEISRRTGWSSAKVRDHLLDLDRKGLVIRSPESPPRFTPTAPAAALGSLIRQQELHLQNLRDTLDRYVERYTVAAAASDPRSVIEVVLGRESVLQRVTQIQESAETEMLVFDRPPYVAHHKQVEGAELRQLNRGVCIRVIYERRGLEETLSPATLADLVVRGEDARALDSLPTKLLLADRSVAVVPLGPGEVGLDGVIVVKADALINSLVSLFESLWRLAVPVSAQPTEVSRRIPLRDRELLTLICTGMKDDAISRRLGISRRTVQRRLERLREEFGAQNRAHLIVLASQSYSGETSSR